VESCTAGSAWRRKTALIQYSAVNNYSVFAAQTRCLVQVLTLNDLKKGKLLIFCFRVVLF
jgi:hypothetical protein